MRATPASSFTMVRRLLAGSLVIAAAVLLGGCVKITASSATQTDVLGPLRTEHTMCMVLEGGGSGACPSASAAGLSAGAGQLLLAYRVPDWAPAPTDVALHGSGTFAGSTLSFTPNSGYASLLQSQFPRAGTKWYGFISQTSPQIPAGGSVTGKYTATWDIPDAQTGSFATFVMTGFRLVGGGYGTSERVVECSPVPFADPGYQYDDAICSSGWWPTDGDSDPSDETHEVILRNRLVLSGPAGATVAAGSGATVNFTTSGAVPFLNANVPAAATTTAPGGTASAPSQTPIAGSHTIPVAVNVPASTPPGIFSVRLTVGTGAGAKVVDVPLTVVATPAGGGSGGAGTGGGSTPTPTTPTPTTPAGPATAPAPDPSTFAGSAAAAGAELSTAAGREALRTGRLRIKVRASGRGVVEATLKSGRTLLAKGQITAKRRGLVTVKLKLRPAGRTVLGTNSTINGTLKVRFKPRGRAATTTSVAVTLPARS